MHIAKGPSAQLASPVWAPKRCLRAVTCPDMTSALWPACLLQWDKVENKTSVVVYGAGSIVTLWLASTIVGALNGIPLVSTLPAQLPPLLRASGAHARAHCGVAAARGGHAAAGTPCLTLVQDCVAQEHSCSRCCPLVPAYPSQPLSPARVRCLSCRPPQVPKLFELVGLGYTAWFTYRYLLFKSSREELVEDIESLKKKIRCGVGGWVGVVSGWVGVVSGWVWMGVLCCRDEARVFHLPQAACRAEPVWPECRTQRRLYARL